MMKSLRTIFFFVSGRKKLSISMIFFPLWHMNNSVKSAGKILILLVYLSIIMFILESHYVVMGECVARIYYYPLGIWDYILIPLVGLIMLFLSLYYIHISLKIRAIEVFIYTSIITFILICGNNILASRTEDWPEAYQVKSVEHMLLISLQISLPLLPDLKRVRRVSCF